MEFTNVYIKNFGDDMDDDRLREIFSKFGEYSCWRKVSLCLINRNWQLQRKLGRVLDWNTEPLLLMGSDLLKHHLTKGPQWLKSSGHYMRFPGMMEDNLY